LLREAEVRTLVSLVETIGRALSAVTTRDAWGFFERCGFRRVNYYEVRFIVRRLTPARGV